MKTSQASPRPVTPEAISNTPLGSEASPCDSRLPNAQVSLSAKEHYVDCEVSFLTLMEPTLREELQRLMPQQISEPLLPSWRALTAEVVGIVSLLITVYFARSVMNPNVELGLLLVLALMLGGIVHSGVSEFMRYKREYDLWANSDHLKGDRVEACIKKLKARSRDFIAPPKSERVRARRSPKHVF